MKFLFNDVLKQFKKKISFNYLLLVIEFVCASLIPWLLGKTIDSLLAGSYLMFGIYISCTLINLIVGVSRRALDTRIFAVINNNLCLQTISRLFEKNIDSNKISARINNISKFTNFYESFAPQFVKSSIQMIVAFVILNSNIQKFSFVVLLIMCLTLLASYIVAEKTEVLMVNIQAEEELRQHYLFAERDVDKLTDVHNNLGKFYINKSDLDAANWGFFDVCYYACEILVLYILIQNNHTVGEITSSLLYVNSFCTHFSMFTYAFAYFKELKVAEDFLKKED